MTARIYLLSLLAITTHPYAEGRKYDFSSPPLYFYCTYVSALVHVYVRYEDGGNSFLQILTQEDWNIVLFSGMKQTSHWAALYFVALMTFGNYVLFNLLVAILVEGFSNQVRKNLDVVCVYSAQVRNPGANGGKTNVRHTAGALGGLRCFFLKSHTYRTTVKMCAPPHSKKRETSLNFFLLHRPRAYKKGLFFQVSNSISLSLTNSL